MNAEEHTVLIDAWLDLIVAELKAMGKDGHFDEMEANTIAGAVHYELSKLRDELKKTEGGDKPD